MRVCEDGSELAWIDGDPESEYPAPRLLILPAGYEPPTRIDDVPADAPGREQLVEIVGVDNSDATTTTSAAPTTSTTAAADTSTTAVPTDPTEAAVPEAEGDDGGALPIVLVLGGAAVAAGLVSVAFRHRGGAGMSSR